MIKCKSALKRLMSAVLVVATISGGITMLNACNKTDTPDGTAGSAGEPDNTTTLESPDNTTTNPSDNTTVVGETTTSEPSVPVPPTESEIVKFDEKYYDGLEHSRYKNDSEALGLLGSYRIAFQANSGAFWYNGEKHTDCPAARVIDGELFVPTSALQKAGVTVSGGKVKGKSVTTKIFGDTVFVSLADAADAAWGFQCFFDGITFAFVKQTISNSDKNESTYIEAYNYLLYPRMTATEIYREYVAADGGKHRSVIASDEQFEELMIRAKTDDVLRLWINRLLVYADSLVAAGNPEWSTYDNKRIGCANRDTNKMMQLIAAYKLTGDKKYFNKINVYIKAFGSFPHFNPNHFLDVGNICASFAVAYDLCYEDFTAEERKNMCTWILQKGLNPAFSTISRANIWTSYVSNWNFVCNGGVALAAIAFMDEYPEICSTLLALTLRGLEYGLNEFAPAGGWEEGPGYWEYGNQYLSYLFLSLEQTFGTDFGYYYSSPGISETGYFALSLDGAVGSFNYHDTPQNSYLNAPEISFHAYMTKDEALSYARICDIALYNYTPDLIDILCCDTTAAPSVLPLDIYTKGEETGAFRSDYGSKTNTYLGWHVGQNTANHFNYDAGNFVFDSNGVRWAVDNGYVSFSDYDAGGWGTRDNNRFYVKRTEGQNCYVINPSNATGQVTNTSNSVTKLESSETTAFAITDIRSSYGSVVSSALRGFMLTENRTAAVIRDEINFSLQSKFYWFMHTNAEVTINGNTATLTQNGQTLTVKFVSNQALTLSVMDAVPLPTSSTAAGTLPTGTKKLVISGTVTGPLTLSVSLNPASDGAVDNTPLSQWSVTGAAK